MKDRDAAKAWVISNQFGRRNLAPFVRAELALQLEPLIASGAKQKQKEAGGAVPQKSAKAPIDTRAELAKVAFCNNFRLMDCVVRDTGKATEPVKQKLRSGATTINAVYGEIQRQEKRTKRTERDAAKLEALPKDRCRLIHADFAIACQQVEPNTVDAIITDPPYSQEFLPLYEKLAEAAPAILKPGGSLLVMVGQSYLPEILALMTPHIRYHWTAAYLTPGGQSVQLWQRKVNTFWHHDAFSQGHIRCYELVCQ